MKWFGDLRGSLSSLWLIPTIAWIFFWTLDFDHKFHWSRNQLIWYLKKYANFLLNLKILQKKSLYFTNFFFNFLATAVKSQNRLMSGHKMAYWMSLNWFRCEGKWKVVVLSRSKPINYWLSDITCAKLFNCAVWQIPGSFGCRLFCSLCVSAKNSHHLSMCWTSEESHIASFRK